MPRTYKSDKTYYLLYIGYQSGGRYYKFSESRKAEAMALYNTCIYENIFCTLKVIGPEQIKPSTHVQLSMFDNN